VVPANVIAQLSDYGRACMEARRTGQSVTDSRFGWDFVGVVFSSMAGVERDQVIQELYDAAESSGDQLTIFGAYRLLAEYDGGLTDWRFLRLCDESLNYLKSLKFSSGHLTGYESARWVNVHGDLRTSFDGIEDVEVPSQSDQVSLKPLDLGESRMIALMSPLPDGNSFFAERRHDGTFVAWSERSRSSDDPTRTRCEEFGGREFSDLSGLYRAMGNMLRLQPYWADEELQPYFPERRS
jgi:hypothetical protein